MVVVAGPPGSGKSSAFPADAIGVDTFNVDDRCRDLHGSYHGIPPETRAKAAAECEAFVEGHIAAGKAFAVETSLATDISIRQAVRAHASGFLARLEYVTAGSAEECIRRVQIRADGCGHAAPEATLRAKYSASLGNLATAIAAFDLVVAWDNSGRVTPTRATRAIEVLRAIRGRVTYSLKPPPPWLKEALHSSRYRLP